MWSAAAKHGGSCSLTAQPLARGWSDIHHVSGLFFGCDIKEKEALVGLPPATEPGALQIDDGGNIDILCENDMDSILELLHELRPKAVVLDSVQTVSFADVTGGSGSVSQVRECSRALVTVCKQSLGVPVFLVGHVTKGGDIAGPKTLEHIVDTTLYLEGEEGSSTRILRTNKNRCVCRGYPTLLRRPHSVCRLSFEDTVLTDSWLPCWTRKICRGGV
jgi:hypothetical protein